MKTSKNKFYIFVSCSLLVVVWYILSLSINDDFLFPKFNDVLSRIINLLFTKNFIKRIFYSINNILIGVVLSYICSIFFSILSLKFNCINILLKPYISIIKSTPVASFIIFCLIFLPINRLSLFISFLMSFPVVYENLYFGISSVDDKLIEMANVYKLNIFKKILFIYIPHLEPNIFTIIKLSISLSFKAGIAAEVIGIPPFTIGELLYQSKIYMDTTNLLALTIIIVLSSFIIEFIFKNIIFYLYKLLYK